MCVYTTSVPVLCNLHNHVQEIELGNADNLCVLPTSRNTQTGKDILGGNFILEGKTGKVEEIFAQLLMKF